MRRGESEFQPRRLTSIGATLRKEWCRERAAERPLPVHFENTDV